MKTNLFIPYIDRQIPVELPAENILFDICPKDYPPVLDFEGTIEQALAEPIGALPLHQRLQPGMKVAIISDDNTRITPTDRIIPILLNAINRAGVPDRDIFILISSGTHRAMTTQEIEEKYGQAVLSRVPILPHRYKDPSELVEYGKTASGTRIFVNRRVIEADFRIAVGNIIPHHPAGWSGGAKAVLPGVAGEETVAKMHLFGSRYPALGVIDSAMRREMEAFAEQIHLDAILNVVLNRAGELVGAVSGHFIHAHRKGVALSKEVYGIPIPARADLVISSTSPVDFDFFQGDKGITSAEPAVKDGGEILCVSGCIEGISPAHPELVDYVGKLTNSQIWEKLEQGEIPDPLTAAEAIVINDIRDKMRITMATGGLSPQICQSMGLGHIEPDRLNAYLQQRLKENPQLTIGIMRQSAELFPYIGTE